jgi:hypothetical protein
MLSREVSDLFRWYFHVGHDLAFDNPDVIVGFVADIVNDESVVSAIDLRDEVWPLTRAARLANMRSVPRLQYYNEAARCIRRVTEDMIQRGMWIVVASLEPEVRKVCPGSVSEAITAMMHIDCADIDGDLPLACRFDSGR